MNVKLSTLEGLALLSISLSAVFIILELLIYFASKRP